MIHQNEFAKCLMNRSQDVLFSLSISNVFEIILLESIAEPDVFAVFGDMAAIYFEIKKINILRHVLFLVPCPVVQVQNTSPANLNIRTGGMQTGFDDCPTNEI